MARTMARSRRWFSTSWGSVVLPGRCSRSGLQGTRPGERPDPLRTRWFGDRMGARSDTLAPLPPRYTPAQVVYAAACAYAERMGVAPRHVELFRDDVADPEAVDTLADRDPGFRLDLAELIDPAAYVAALAREASLGHVWSQVVDQLPAPPLVAVPIRGTVS